MESPGGADERRRSKTSTEIAMYTRKFGPVAVVMMLAMLAVMANIVSYVVQSTMVFGDWAPLKSEDGKYDSGWEWESGDKLVVLAKTVKQGTKKSETEFTVEGEFEKFQEKMLRLRLRDESKVETERYFNVEVNVKNKTNAAWQAFRFTTQDNKTKETEFKWKKNEDHPDWAHLHATSGKYAEFTKIDPNVFEGASQVYVSHDKDRVAKGDWYNPKKLRLHDRAEAAPNDKMSFNLLLIPVGNPEPSTVLLTAAGLATLLGIQMKWRRKRLEKAHPQTPAAG